MSFVATRLSRGMIGTGSRMKVLRHLSLITRLPSTPQRSYATAKRPDGEYERGQIICAKAFRGDLEAVKRLVAGGADVNQGDYDFRTALHLAASEGHADVVKYLLAQGANPNSEDRWGGTPLRDAIQGHHPAVVQLLRERGGVVGQKEMGAAMCRAAANGDIREVKYLVESGIGVNTGDYDLRTPLHLAASNGRAEVIRLLLELGARADVADRFGNFPIMDAARQGHQNCVELLMRAGHGVLESEKLPKVELMSEYQEHMNETLKFLLNEKVYRSSVVHEEVDFFYNKLKLQPFYFARFKPQETANHIQCYMAAKKLAQAANRRQDIELAMESTDGGFLLCPADDAELVATEKKVERLVAKIQKANPSKVISMVSFLSRGMAVPYGSKKLGMYIIDTVEVPKVDADEHDLMKVAAKEFLGSRTDLVKSRYQELLNEATQRLSPIIRSYDTYRDGTTPMMIAFRREVMNVSISDIAELLHAHNFTCERKMWETFSNGVTVYSFYIHQRPEGQIEEFANQLSLLFCVPRSKTLSTVFFGGSINAVEYAYAVCVRKFVYYFISQSSEDYNILLDYLDKDRVNRSRLISLGRKMKRDTISENRIAETMRKYPELVRELFEDFDIGMNPHKGKKRPTETDRASVRSRINQEVHEELDQAILNMCLVFNTCVLKTNFYRKTKSSLAFRLSPDFLAGDRYYPQIPYAVFFVLANDFHGFHTRFSDIARGGIRVVKSRDNATFDRNNETVFQEGYNLAHTQNFKNKDIPEFGSKGVILLGFDYQNSTRYAFRKYISGLLDLLVKDKENGEMADHYGKEEILFLGPDENTADLMEWACLYARRRGYPQWKSFTTGKPPTIGGIPHDVYGMTTRSVHKYVVSTLTAKGLKEEACTKLQTGGPDGDLGSNEILLSKDSTIGVVDGSGVAYDPSGLNREELTRLAKERRTVSYFDRSKLAPGGFVILVEDRNVTLPNGEAVESGLQFRNEFHLHPLSSADLFVPCGGRPEAVNVRNVGRMFQKDGVTPRFKYIIEGANLFFTNEARLILEKAGVVLFKDASTNKGGVTSSSLEVLAALTLTDEEFKEHMCVHDGGVPPFYHKYVKAVQSKIEAYAEREWACIWKEHARTGTARTDLTNIVSHKINVLNDAITSSTLWDKKQLRDRVLKDAIPECLIRLVGGLDVALKRIPDAYARAIFSANLASQYIYTYGLTGSEFTFYEFVDATFFGAGKPAPSVASVTAEEAQKTASPK